MAAEEVVSRMQETAAVEQRLQLSDFDLSNGTSGSKTKIAEYQADLPIALREEAMRLVFVSHENFTTDGAGGNTETFNVSEDLIETPNTTDLVTFLDGDRAQPDSIDYANNAFDFTAPTGNSDLDVYYVHRTPVRVTIEKHAPTGQGSVSEILYDDVTAILHERNQNQEPPVPSMTHTLQPVVPADYSIEVYADGPAALDYYESSQGTEAPNAMLSIPINRSTERIEGLSRAVKQDIIDRV
jgi:hypothetical protein